MAQAVPVALQVEPLELRVLLAATNPFDLGTLDGTTGFRLDGIDADDLSGIRVSSAGDVNGDGFDDLIIGAPRADPGGDIDAGESYVVFGKSSGFTAAIDLSTLNGTTGFRLDGIDADDLSGIEVSSAGDVNGDSFADILIGAFLGDPGGDSDAGESYVVFGKSSDFTAVVDLSTLNGTDGFRLDGIDAGDRSGASVSSAGDVNGDGFDDLIIGAPGGDPGGDSEAGESCVVFGKSSGFTAVVDLSTLNGTDGFRLDGLDAGDNSGDSVSSAGDVNGDGFDDILIEARHADGSEGESYVVFGKLSGFTAAVDLSTLNGTDGFQLDGIDHGDQSGRSVSSAGDVNGDGFDDLIIGALYADPGGDSSAGESYVVFGKSSGFTAAIDLSTLNGTNGFRLDGIDAGDQSGVSVSSAGDVNADGFDDVIIGANGGTPGGESYVVFGKSSSFTAAIDLSTLNGTTGFRLDGIDAGDQSGVSVSSAGDVNGDGFDDLIIGAESADPGGDSAAGESYVVFGGNFTGGAETQVGDASANALTASQGAGAIDILVGGQGNDTLISDGGNDVLYGGEGDDTVAIVSTAFQRVAGGNGSDTLRLDGSGLTLDLTTTADNTLTDIEVIDITGSGTNTLTLDFLEVINISSTSNTLRVLADGDDTVNIGAGWTQESNQTIDAVVYEIFIQGAATLRIQLVVSYDFLVTESGDSTSVSESGSTDSFEVVLTTQPVSDVVLIVTSGDETDVAVNPSTLTFSTSNWNFPQTVVVTAVEDSVRDGNQSVSVTVSVDADASDDDFDFASDQAITVTSIDDDFISVSLDGAGNLVLDDNSIVGLPENLTLLVLSGELLIIDPDNVLVSSVGTQVSDNEVRVPLTLITNQQVVVNHNRGDDRLNAASLGTGLSLVAAGGPGDDTITGSSQNDTISGGTGEDSILAGSGDDLIDGGDGDDDLDGNGGTDVLTITEDGQLSITATQTFGQGTDTFANIEQAVLEGGSRNNRLDASLATIPVTLLGQAGNDTLLGGSAADVLDGGAGSDFAEVFGSNIVLTDGSVPGAGAETLIALEGLQLVAAARGSSIDASGYTLGSVTIIGSSGNDTLKGGSAGDMIMAGAGRDSVDGGNGADFITGGHGRDTINGNGGNDSVFGSGGQDLIDGGSESDVLIGGVGRDTIRGSDGTDRVFGGGDRDVIDGDSGADTLFGGNGRDNIAGGLGADRLNGVDRDDSFNQQVGPDLLIGGIRPAERGVLQRSAEQPDFQLPPASQSSSENSDVIDEAFADVLLPELLEL